jgi:hypothetical protein
MRGQLLYIHHLENWYQSTPQSIKPCRTSCRGPDISPPANGEGDIRREKDGRRTCSLITRVINEDKIDVVLMKVVEPDLLLPTLTQIQGCPSF